MLFEGDLLLPQTYTSDSLNLTPVPIYRRLWRRWKTSRIKTIIVSVCFSSIVLPCTVLAALAYANETLNFTLAGLDTQAINLHYPDRTFSIVGSTVPCSGVDGCTRAACNAAQEHNATAACFVGLHRDVWPGYSACERNALQLIDWACEWNPLFYAVAVLWLASASFFVGFLLAALLSAFFSSNTQRKRIKPFAIAAFIAHKSLLFVCTVTMTVFTHRLFASADPRGVAVVLDVRGKDILGSMLSMLVAIECFTAVSDLLRL